MAFYLGNYGNIRLRRGTEKFLGSIEASIAPDDVSTTLERVGVSNSVDNIISGDRIDITTTDSRGLVFIAASNWSNSAVQDTFSAFVNVNPAGGLRFYPTFESSINNVRSSEISLQAFAGDAIEVTIRVRDTVLNALGNVSSYEFNTSRESVDTTSLSDKHKQQYNAGLISGSGRIECFFDYTVKAPKEAPVVMLQTIQRLDFGCAFDIALYLTDEQIDPEVSTVFYQTTAVTTNTGISVETGGIVSCTIDFITTGEIRLIIGRPSDYILKEDDDRIKVEQDLGFLLQEVKD